MVNVAKMLANYLKTREAITDLVNTKVYWLKAPAQITSLHLVVTLIDGNRYHNLDYAAPSLQVSAFGKKEEEVEQLKEAVIAELRDGRHLINGVFVVSVYMDDRMFEDKPWTKID